MIVKVEVKEGRTFVNWFKIETDDIDALDEILNKADSKSWSFEEYKKFLENNGCDIVDDYEEDESRILS